MLVAFMRATARTVMSIETAQEETGEQRGTGLGQKHFDRVLIAGAGSGGWRVVDLDGAAGGIEAVPHGFLFGAGDFVPASVEDFEGCGDGGDIRRRLEIPPPQVPEADFRAERREADQHRHGEGEEDADDAAPVGERVHDPAFRRW